MNARNCCAKCAFFMHRDEDDLANQVGECHRYAPRPVEYRGPSEDEKDQINAADVATDQAAWFWRWPIVGEDTFCGEWRQRQ